MRVVLVGCMSCGSVTLSLGAVRERCSMERSSAVRARATGRRVRVRRALPRKRAA